jgi:hypothetical protein
MAEHDPPPTAADEAQARALVHLTQKLDTVAGALAAIAGSHTDLLGHVAEAESRRSHDAREVAQRLGALERQILALPSQVPAPPVDPLDPFPPSTLAADVERLRSDLALCLDVLAQVAEGVERLEHPSPGEPSPPAAPMLEAVAQDLEDRIALHTDVALAGALRVIDARLTALREALATGGPANVAGFEAGAVMGATQAAWTRLEQRLDAEFDDLGRQLQAMVVLIERTATITESVANRPVVTGDQLRRAAAAVKESVAGAGRSRRDRHGGQRGLGPGS